MAARDLRLDSLRGIFLVIMTIDHIGGKLTAYTYEPLGFVSAAAAFVLLSAYMYAYTTRNTPPTRAALGAQSWKRAAKLYRYHLALFVLLVLLTVLSPVHDDYLGRQFYPNDMPVWKALAYGAVLVHQPKLMQLLPMYLVLSLASPAMLLAFRRGWFGLVFGLSFTLWLWGQFFDPLEWMVAAIGAGTQAGDFNLLSWQLLWVAGLYIGFVHGVEKRKVLVGQPWVLGLAVGAALVFFLDRHDFVQFADSMDFYTENPDVRVLRLLNIFCQVVIFCHLVRFLPADRGLPWFRLLGRYSLPVFCFHVLVVSFLEPVSWRIGMNFGYAVEVAYLLAVVASLTLPALFYRAYERQMRHAAAATWRSRLSATAQVGRELFRSRQAGRNKRNA